MNPCQKSGIEVYNNGIVILLVIEYESAYSRQQELHVPGSYFPQVTVPTSTHYSVQPHLILKQLCWLYSSAVGRNNTVKKILLNSITMCTLQFLKQCPEISLFNQFIFLYTLVQGYGFFVIFTTALTLKHFVFLSKSIQRPH